MPRFRQASKFVLLPILLIFGSIAVPPAHAAIDFLTLLSTLGGIAQLTCDGEATAEQEAQYVASAWNTHRSKSSRPAIAQATANGAGPSLVAPVGSTVTLGFRFVDPSTELPTTGPVVHRVDYKASLDHQQPLVLTDLGTSFDSGSSFALPYVVADCEPVIVAVPFDAGGAEVVLPGPVEGNEARGAMLLIRPDAVPGTAGPGLWIAGLALMGAGLLALRRRRETAS